MRDVHGAAQAAFLDVIALMNDDDPHIAFRACEAVLMRGIGDKPMRVDLTVLSEEQRKSLAEILRLMFGG